MTKLMQNKSSGGFFASITERTASTVALVVYFAGTLVLYVSSVDFLGKSVIAFNNHLLSFPSKSKQLKSSQGPLDNLANKYDWPVNDYTVKSVIYMSYRSRSRQHKLFRQKSTAKAPFSHDCIQFLTWVPQLCLDQLITIKICLTIDRSCMWVHVGKVRRLIPW